jgi:hypothetical protein
MYSPYIIFFCRQRRSILLTKTPATAIHIALMILEPSLMIHRMAIQWGAEIMNGDRRNPKIV